MLRHIKQDKCEQCRAAVLYHIRESEIDRFLRRSRDKNRSVKGESRDYLRPVWQSERVSCRRRSTARNTTSARNAGTRWSKSSKEKAVQFNREIVFLPPLTDAKEREDEGPLPGEPPKIWGTWGAFNRAGHS